MSRYVNPVAQYLDGASSPVVNGKLFYFESEQNLAKSTFADQAETILNTNPVILDSAGRTPNIFYTGSARVVLQDAAGVQIWERDPVGDTSSFADFGQWLSYITYDLNSIVKLFNNFYMSKTIAIKVMTQAFHQVAMSTGLKLTFWVYLIHQQLMRLGQLYLRLTASYLHQL